MGAGSVRNHRCFQKRPERVDQEDPMLSLLYYGPKDIRLEEIDRPQPKEKDVIVKVMRAGICGSDLKAYLHDGHSVGILWKDKYPGIDG